MTLEKSIILDSILFYIVNIYIVVYVMKKNIPYKEKISYILLFIIMNSSYNIMIKPIHEFNKLIPRNFIWNYEIIGPIGIMDLLFFILFIINSIDIVRSFKYSKILKLIYTREVILVLIAIISFIVNQGYFLDSGKRFFIECKGIIYLFTTIILTIKFINRDVKDVDYFKIITIILLSGSISLLFFDKYYLWSRYGMTIKIIDQEDAYTISMIAIYYYLYKYIRLKSKKDLCLFIILAIQNLMCVYKYNIVYMLLSIAIIFLVMIPKTKLSYFIVNILSIGIVELSLLNIEKIKYMVTSNAIYTRVFQATDFINEMINRGVYSITFGLGMGTPYLSTFDIGDSGEVKTIDKAMDYMSSYRNVVQVPLLGTIKYVGIAGFVIYIIYSIRILINIITNVFKYRNTINDELKSLITIFILHLFFSNAGFIITGTSAWAVFNGFMIGRIVVEMKKLERR